MSVKISQSLMKSLFDVKQGKECGLFFKARYIDKDPDAETPPSDAMKAGIYFEYLATGALPRDGKVPQPEVAYAGTPREKMTADYERATQSAKLFKKIVSAYGIEIIEKGLYLTDGEINGIVDVKAMWAGRPCYIDIKYSGLLEDRWNELGWQLDSLPYKDKIMLQGVHYKVLAKRCENIEDIPFYYFVFDSKNPKNARIILQNVDETRMAQHEADIVNVRGWLNHYNATGYPSAPSLSRCADCPLAHKCPKKLEIPLIDEVVYGAS